MRTIVLSLLIFNMNSALADPWSTWTKITQIYPYAGGLNFITEYKNTTLSSCNDGGRFTIPISNANYQVLSATLISAFMTGKEISFNINGENLTQSVCSPSINRFVIKN